MPGIAGIIASAPEALEDIQPMVECMMHEPYYVSGQHVDASLGLAAGWVCHAGSFSDCMPVWSEDREVCLIYCGENYATTEEVRPTLSRPPEEGPLNARYLMDLYQQFGLDFLQRLNGWFNGLLILPREKRIHLFNDRYGLGRIYYHENREGFHFSSEAKSLLKVHPELRRLDSPGLGEAVSCGCTLRNRSLFAGVSLLPTGSLWTFTPGGKVDKSVYFKVQNWRDQERLGEEDYYDTLKRTFINVLPRYAGSGERLGVSLTGGVDSRLVMAWLHRTSAKVFSYTFGGPIRDCRDVTIARRVAALSDIPHSVIPMAEDFYRDFPKLAEQTVYITDGVMNMTGTPDLYVNRMARGMSPVRLTGNYGGEILRGLIAFKPAAVKEGLYDPECERHAVAAEETYRQEVAGDDVLSFVAFKQVPWHHYSRFTLERSQLSIRSPYLDNDLVSLAYRAPRAEGVDNAVFLRLIQEGNPALAALGTDRGVATRAIPGWTRARRFYEEFTFKAEYAYDYGMPQWVAAVDHAFSFLRLERRFLGRHKFYHFRTWYRDRLSRYLKDVLLDPRALGRPYLRRGAVEPMLGQHLRGARNFTSELHQLLTLELIQRQLVDGS